MRTRKAILPDAQQIHKLIGAYSGDGTLLPRTLPEICENVRDFVHGWLNGSRAEVPLTDLLTTIAILFAAIEIDLGIESVELLAPLRTMLDTPSVLPAVLRCPGAYRDGDSTVRIRRFPGRRRNASAAFTHLTA